MFFYNLKYSDINLTQISLVFPAAKMMQKGTPTCAFSNITMQQKPQGNNPEISVYSYLKSKDDAINSRGELSVLRSFPVKSNTAFPSTSLRAPSKLLPSFETNPHILAVCPVSRRSFTFETDIFRLHILILTPNSHPSL